jgi:ketosteroid isomerase-like protein
MSQATVELVQAAFRAFQEGYFDRLLGLCDENIEITQPPELPGVSPHQRGHGGVLEAFAIWPEQWDDYRVEIEHVADLDDHVMVTTLQTGLGKSSGVRVETHFTFLFAFRAGKIAEWRMFMQEAEALEAAAQRP